MWCQWKGLSVDLNVIWLNRGICVREEDEYDFHIIDAAFEECYPVWSRVQFTGDCQGRVDPFNISAWILRLEIIIGIVSCVSVSEWTLIMRKRKAMKAENSISYSQINLFPIHEQRRRFPVNREKILSHFFSEKLRSSSTQNVNLKICKDYIPEVIEF